MLDDRPKNPHIARAVQIVGKQAALAEKIGCAQQTISKMLNNEIRIPAELAVKIHDLTGGRVSKSQMRPDLFGRRHSSTESPPTAPDGTPEPQRAAS